MDETPRSTVIVVAIGLALLVVLFLFLGGQQTSTILSKVGASVGSRDQYVTTANPVPDENGAGATPAPTATPGSGKTRPAAAGTPVLLIIRTGTLTLETSSVADVVSEASGLVVDRGGFVAGSKETGTIDSAAATVDYRIPAARWEETVNGLRGLATVRGQEIKTDEVTGTVIDLGARISNLRATEAALQAIMAKAVKIDEILDVQAQLTETRGQIEELSAQKSSLEDRAAYGSLTVVFQLPPAPKPSPTAAATPAWDPGKDVEGATARLVRISQRATSAGIWIGIVGLPIIAALAVGLGVVWALWRFVSRRRSAATAAAG